MEKKVMKALFANVCDRNSLRPIMTGVHFDEERDCCYASDGHILVIYNENDKRFMGKTIAADGSEIEGKYPNVFSVFPDGDYTEVDIDVAQMLRACQWHKKKDDATINDAVVMQGVALGIYSLSRLLATLETVRKQPKVKFIFYAPERAVVVKSEKMTSLIMPMLFESDTVDSEREYGDQAVISYESFINDYVFNSWKKQTGKSSLGWLD